jgi:ribosomal protein S18 acetylase RimI-like enzyme
MGRRVRVTVDPARAANRTGVSIERVDARHAAAAAATPGAAFLDDPLVRFIAPDETRRRQAGPWYLGIVVQYGLRWGEVWGTHDASAVAVWLPPDSGEMRLGRTLRLGVARVPLRLGLSGSRRLLQALSATEPFHRTVQGPHWYLVAVGTRADRRGQGLGSALVDVGTSMADAAGLPCYLETATPTNIRFYLGHGFAVIGQTELKGCTLTGGRWFRCARCEQGAMPGVRPRPCRSAERRTIARCVRPAARHRGADHESPPKGGADESNRWPRLQLPCRD